jgi:hypothetical protein
LPFQQFHHQEWLAVVFANIMQGTDVGMVKAEAACASRWNRFKASGSWAEAAGRNFSATSRSSRVSLARQTCLRPPPPSWASIRVRADLESGREPLRFRGGARRGQQFQRRERQNRSAGTSQASSGSTSRFSASSPAQASSRNAALCLPSSLSAESQSSTAFRPGAGALPFLRPIVAPKGEKDSLRRTGLTADFAIEGEAAGCQNQPPAQKRRIP